MQHLHLHAIYPPDQMGFFSRLAYRPNSLWFVTVIIFMAMNEFGVLQGGAAPPRFFPTLGRLVARSSRIEVITIISTNYKLFEHAKIQWNATP